MTATISHIIVGSAEVLCRDGEPYFTLPGNSSVIPVLKSAEQVPKYMWLPLACFEMPFRGINSERDTAERGALKRQIIRTGDC